MSFPYAEVIGDPVAHSKSPIIHKFWLTKLGLRGEYKATHVTADALAAHLDLRRADADWRGCSITIPHKMEVIAHLDRIDPSAAKLGAVNTVVVENEALIGYNTDVVGVREALSGEDWSGARVLVVGAGGAARAAVAAFEGIDAVEVMIFARNSEQLTALAAQPINVFIIGSPFYHLSYDVQFADLIINASPVGMVGRGNFGPDVLDAVACCDSLIVFDMVYEPLETPLLAAARARGLDTIDGLAMLIGQAAAAFERFYGVPAPREHDAELRALLTA